MAGSSLTSGRGSHLATLATIAAAGIITAALVGAVVGGPASPRDSPVPPSRPMAPAVPRVERPPVALPSETAPDSSHRARAAYQNGDVPGALGDYQRAVDVNPDDADALNNLGQLLVRSGRAAESIARFDRAIALAGDVWAYHFNRARAYGQLGQWGPAIEGYREALRLFPEDYATQFNLAKALQATGDLPGAIQAFERAIALAPGQADFHLSHGLALEAAQRPSEAATAYARFLELAPDAADAGKVKARIAALRRDGAVR